MENYEYIKTLLEGNAVLGKKEILSDRLSIIPVYRLKVSCLNLSTDIKNNASDGATGSVSVVPICLIKIFDEEVSVVHLENKQNKDELFDVLPNIISNLDISGILKNIKM